MKSEMAQGIWRWTRGLGVLSLVTVGVVTSARNAQTLTLNTAEIKGAHHGQGKFTPPVNLATIPWTLNPAYAATGEETMTIDVGTGPYTPDNSKTNDVYHCFLLEPKFARDVMVTGAEVVPGNRQIVHHAILYKVEPEQAAAVMAKDKAGGGNGWDCFGGPGLPQGAAGAAGGGNWLSVWVPGADDGHFPDGIGNPMRKGSMIVMEVHYNVNNGVASDRSKVKLRVAPEGRKLTSIASQLRIAPVEIRCPENINTPECTRENTVRENVARAGELAGNFLPRGMLQRCGQTAEQYQKKPVGDGKNIAMSCDQKNETDMTMYSIGGHMHLLAKSIKIELNPGTSGAKTLIHIPKWDFHWQGNYWFKTPVEVKRGDTIRTTCTFDNSPENQPVIAGTQTKPRYVMWAEATTDEMCLGIIMASVKKN
jgi:hypothetical protein